MNMNAGFNPFATKPIDFGAKIMGAVGNAGPQKQQKASGGSSLLQRLAQIDAGTGRKTPPAVNQQKGVFAAAFSLNTLG